MSLLRLTSALVLAWACRTETITPPHVMIILVDDLGWHNVGFHNAAQRSPAINELVKSGAELRRHYSYKFCSPSRSALMSGRLPIHVNEANPATITDVGGVDLRMTMLPKKLQAVGYETAMVGKWHLGARQWPNLPRQRGFNHHLGFLTGGEDHFTQIGYEASHAVDLWQNDAPAYGKNGTYSCELYGQEAVRIINSHNSSTPLFMYLAMQDTHAPYQCPSKYLDNSVDFNDRRVMQGMVTCVDEVTHNVTEALRAHGMWDNTFLLWSADNGGPQYWSANNYPLRGGKGTDFEGGVRAASFVAGGAVRLPPGATVDVPIHFADWYATFCTMAGIDPQDNVQGVPPIDSIDQSSVFKTVGAPAARTEVPLSSNAIIVGDLKLVLNTTKVLGHFSGYWTGETWPIDNGHSPLTPDPGCPPQGCLFNLTTDETEHLEISAQLPQELERLRRRLTKILEGKFQTNYTDPEAQHCVSLKRYVDAHKGFAGPICSYPAGENDNIYV